MASEPQRRSRHTPVEDVFALAAGSLFVSFGLFLLKDQGLLTGGNAGLALVLSKLSGWSFGAIFFVLNLPFYGLALSRMGWRFTVNTLVSVTVVSLLTENLHRVVGVEHLNAAFAAVMGGFMIGTGILILFRHHSSLGGVGVMALYLQDRFGFSAGKFQMAVDVTIVGVGFFLVSIPLLACSIIGVLALNQVIALNHRQGRYQIT